MPFSSAMVYSHPMAETSVIYRKGSTVRVAHTAAERVQLEWEGFVLDPSTPATQPVEQASATPTPDLPVEPSETEDDFDDSNPFD